MPTAEDSIQEAACDFVNPATGVKLRDSVCWASGGGTPAVAAFGFNSAIFTVVLRNVTAIAASGSGDDLGVFARTDETDDTQVTVDAKNVIAAGDIADVGASTGSLPGQSATVTLAYSNYDSQLEFGTGATVTDPNTGTNQADPPVFVDAAIGDFHQAPGSTATIDKGALLPDLGLSDIDGEFRNQGAAPDIGADEFVPPAPPVPPGGDQGVVDATSPNTTITKGPKDKTRKKTATFEFTGTDARAVASFQCKLDAGAFAPCTSPHTVKVKKGKHTFQIEAIDQAGNVGAPATDTWKRKKKK